MTLFLGIGITRKYPLQSCRIVKNALVATDTLNDKVLPWFEEQEVRVLRVLTDRGTEYCGAQDRYEYELYLSIEDIDHTRTRAKHPQTNGICERLHQTIQNEFYSIDFRKKVYQDIDELQADLDNWLQEYKGSRVHSEKYCYGKTPLQTFIESKYLAQAKMLDKIQLTAATTVG